MASNADAVIRALAGQQASTFNASPFSQSISKRIVNPIAEALLAPGNALNGAYNYAEVEPSGYVRPFNSALMDAATNMAGTIGLSSIAAPKPSNALTSGFSDWFGNSQVTKPDGAPLTLYHGTTGNFDSFRVPVDGAGNQRAVYFTPDPAVASQYAAGKGSVVPVYVKADKLLTVDLKGGATDALGRGREAIARKAREEGYDAVLFKNTSDVGGIQDQYAVFNPTQIKSAIGNSGAYNPADPNIVRISGVPLIPSDQGGER